MLFSFGAVFEEGRRLADPPGAAEAALTAPDEALAEMDPVGAAFAAGRIDERERRRYAFEWGHPGVFATEGGG